jgi:hypothetical protein
VTITIPGPTGNIDVTGFAPAAWLKAAEIALDRGPGLDDLPTLALAAPRAGPALQEQLAPWARLWEELPEGATPDLVEELTTVFDVAGRLSAAKASLFARRTRSASPAAHEAAERELERRIRERMDALAAREPRWIERPAGADYQAARTQILAEDAEHVRRMQAEIDELGRNLTDAIHKVWAAVRKARGAAALKGAP